MPRKNPSEALQVFNILKFRGLLKGLEVVAIEGKSERQVADVLREALFFFCFGYPEGFGLPAMEAMASGCVVVGYHGWGGREVFGTEFSYPVEPGDVLTFARRAEDAILTWRMYPDVVRKKGERAATSIRQHYSPEQEEHDIMSFWRGVFERQSRA